MEVRFLGPTQSGDAALPLYVIMSPDDKEIVRFAGMTRDVKAYLEFLKKGL